MQRDIQNVEDVLSDDGFMAWYHKEQNARSEEWENWLARNPAVAPLVTEALHILNSLPADRVEQEYSDTKTLEGIQAKIDFRKPRPLFYLRFFKIAAAIAALLVISVWAYRQYSIKNPLQEWQTAYGTIDTIKLEDGSIVYLNANSSLKGKNLTTNASARELWIEGEAYFSIQSQPNKQPFIVHTPKADIVVTGTRFNVRSRNQQLRVLLTEGSINLIDQHTQTHAIVPGQMVSISNDVMNISTVDSSAILAWRNGNIELNNCSATELASIIEEYYGKTVIIKGTAKDSITITGTMPNNQLQDLLQAVQLVTTWKIDTELETILIDLN